MSTDHADTVKVLEIARTIHRFVGVCNVSWSHYKAGLVDLGCDAAAVDACGRMGSLCEFWSSPRGKTDRPKSEIAS